MNRDLVSHVLAVVGQVVGELAVQLDLSLFDELKNDGRGELLGDRSESKLRVGSVRNVPLHIRKSNPALVNHFSILCDKGGAVKLAVLVREREHLLDLRGMILGESRLGMQKSS